MKHIKETKMVREFTPNWFAVNMGTGVLALILFRFSITLGFLFPIGAALAAINVLLFCLFLGLFMSRFVFYPKHFLLLIQHPVQSLSLGSLPMGLSVIANCFIAFGIPCLGVAAAVHIAAVLWWIVVCLALFISWLIPICMFLMHEHTEESMTPMWLLPLVACEVAAGTGGLLIPYLAEFIRSFAYLVSMSLWAISVFLAFAVIGMFFRRMVLHSLPGRNFAPSIWLILGPIGTGAYALLSLGHASSSISPVASENFQQMLTLFPGLALWGAIFLWGFGFWWLVIALIASFYYWYQKIPFGLGWWAYTFPLGVYSLASLELAQQTHSLLFWIVAITASVLLLVFWCLISLLTLFGACKRDLFYAPCLVVPPKRKTLP